MSNPYREEGRQACEHTGSFRTETSYWCNAGMQGHGPRGFCSSCIIRCDLCEFLVSSGSPYEMMTKDYFDFVCSVRARILEKRKEEAREKGETK